MKLVEMKCPNCGASIKVDAENKSASCEFCNSTFMLDNSTSVKSTTHTAKSKSIRQIVGIGLFTAIVVVLQLVASTIKFGPFSITLTLAPIIIGTALYGLGAGAWLGLVFGGMVLATGDAAPFLAVNVPGTVLTVLLKGMLAGLAAGAVYKLIEKKGELPAAICAGITAPVVNTGVFVLGCLAFFMPTIKEWAGGGEAIKFLFLSMIGVNFLVELGINCFLATVIVKIIKLGKKENKK